MKKHISSILFLFITCFANTQSLDFIFEDSISTNRLIEFSSQNTYNSSALSNAFMSKFIYGGELNSELINDNSQKEFNVIGGEFDQKLSYYDGSLFKKYPNLGLTIAASDHNFISSSYKNDLYNLVFKGNANYLGDTLDFSYTHFQYLHYQNYGIGVYDKRSFSYIRLGFVVGNSSTNFRFGKSVFNTNTLGDEIYFDAKVSGHTTLKDSSTNYLSKYGYGFALELNHNFILKTQNGKKHIINFNISNLGSIFWNNKTTSYKIDSALTFSGIDYTDIKYYSNYETDAIADSIGLISTKRTVRESLPIKFLIQKVPFYSLTQKWQPTFGFKSILIPDYRPLVYAGIYFQPNKYVGLSSKLIIGGFGGLRLGLNAKFWINDKISLGISTLDFIGTTSNTFGKGKSANFFLSVKL